MIDMEIDRLPERKSRTVMYHSSNDDEAEEMLKPVLTRFSTDKTLIKRREICTEVEV
jgi:hypothetical protein